MGSYQPQVAERCRGIPGLLCMTCVLGLLLNPTKWSCCCKLTVGSSGSHLSWMGPLKAIYSNSPVTRTPTAPPGTQSPIQCDLVHVISHHVPNYTFVCLSAHNPPSHQHPDLPIGLPLSSKLGYAFIPIPASVLFNQHPMSFSQRVDPFGMNGI